MRPCSWPLHNTLLWRGCWGNQSTRTLVIPLLILADSLWILLIHWFCLISANEWTAAVLVFARGREHSKVAEENKDSEAETDQKQSISGADESDRESVCLQTKTDKTVDQSCTGEVMLWASHLQPAPSPSLFPYRAVGKGREGTSGRRAAAEQLRSLSGSSVEHTKTLQQPAALTKQLCILLQVLTGPSPLNQERPGCSSPRLRPPLLDWLSIHLLRSHAWVLGWGE